MKKTLLTLLPAVLLLTSCADLPEMYYQQIYSLRGERTDAYAMYKVGAPLPLKDFETPLQELFRKYPDAAKKLPGKGYRLGWFFRQQKNICSFGEGVADLCGHAAWFVLNAVPEAKRPEYAVKIAEIMVSADEAKALELLEELRTKAFPEIIIQEAKAFYDPETACFLKWKSEHLSIPGTPKFGMERHYYPTGMIAMELYYLDGKPDGYAFVYTENGRIKEVHRYRNGKREMVYSAAPAK